MKNGGGCLRKERGIKKVYRTECGGKGKWELNGVKKQNTMRKGLEKWENG